MGSASATAMLVGRREMIEARPNAVTAEVERSEIEEALRSDLPLELILEVLRPAHEGAEAESGTVTVAWDRADLESLLADSESESMTFSFDRDELERVLDEPEFAGHGLRETALVLTVAAAAAVGASAASGMPMYDDGSGPTTGGVTTLSQSATAATPDAFERAVTRSVPADAFERAAVRGETPAPDAFERAAVRGETPAPDAFDRAVAARGIETPAASVGDSGSGFDLPSIDASTVGAVGGGIALAGLLIVGAGFAARRNRARPV